MGVFHEIDNSANQRVTKITCKGANLLSWLFNFWTIDEATEGGILEIWKHVSRAYVHSSHYSTHEYRYYPATSLAKL